MIMEEMDISVLQVVSGKLKKKREREKKKTEKGNNIV